MRPWALILAILVCGCVCSHKTLEPGKDTFLEPQDISKVRDQISSHVKVVAAVKLVQETDRGQYLVSVTVTRVLDSAGVKVQAGDRLEMVTRSPGKLFGVEGGPVAGREYALIYLDSFTPRGYSGRLYAWDMAKHPGKPPYALIAFITGTDPPLPWPNDLHSGHVAFLELDIMALDATPTEAVRAYFRAPITRWELELFGVGELGQLRALYLDLSDIEFDPAQFEGILVGESRYVRLYPFNGRDHDQEESGLADDAPSE